ncbi:MAG TPA: PVC-type heme-binding CxxCH protein [Pirellulales bacterium]|jgi:putative membrane-bound dehydrogenase-like protein|nr:PVC-type heme-binding CxxCH protein [Pirellulales bacterium]
MQSPVVLRFVVASIVASIGIVASAAEATPDQFAPLSPEEGLKSMIARPGFTVELVAAEPLVMDPVAFAWGADGKLWVVEMADYPLGLDGKGQPGGRVRWLDDTDGDGRYDRSTVFLDGLNFPNGVMPWRNGVLVTCAPEILYAEDTDGDGRADVRKTLYLGFAEGNQQHRMNGLRWGLDNWIHCASGGSSGGEIESKLTGKEVSVSGRDFRIRPDQGLIDPQTGQTQFIRERDDWGNWFGTKNSQPLSHYVLADEYLRRNPHLPPPHTTAEVPSVPGAAPIYPRSPAVARFNDLNKVNRFTSACGETFYRDELFGPGFAGNSFVCEPVHNLVHREMLSPAGATFTSHRAADEKRSEFLASTDPWSRPVMVRTGPDGALWVADMYRLVIEHPQWIPHQWQEKLDVRSGHDRGRIYRVFPSDKRPRAIPRLDQLDTPALVAALDTPNGTTRDMVHRRIVERGDRAAVETLRQFVRSAKRAQTRLTALAALGGLGAIDADVLAAPLGDEHSGVRRLAVGLAEPILGSTPALGERLTKLADDPDAQVQLQVACTLGNWDDARAGAVLGNIALGDSGDPFIVGAVMSSVNRETLGGIAKVVLAASELQKHAELIEKLTTMAVALGDQATLAAIVARAVTPSAGRYAPWQIGIVGSLADALARRKLTLAAYQQQAGEPLRVELNKLAAMFAWARTVAAQPPTAESDRIAALQLLGRDAAARDCDLTLLAGLLGPQTPPPLQAAALTTLVRQGDPRVPSMLLGQWRTFGPVVRGQVLDALLARPLSTNALLDAIERGEIQPAEIDAARVERLVESKDATVAKRAAALLAAARNTDRAKVVEQYRDVLALSGDAAHGAEVFNRRCSACHKLGNVGHAVGPDLTALTDKSPAALLVAVLDPNRAVEAKFINYTAITTDGLVYTGMLAAESGTGVTLLAAEGKEIPLARADLEELASSTKSLMPEGLEKDLSRQDLADVFALLGRSALPRKEFAGNRPAVVKPEALRGEFYLMPQQAEIYGPTLELESRYDNLGFWRSEADHAVWTIDVSRPGPYEASFEYACGDDSAGNTWQLTVDGNRLTGTVVGTHTWDEYRVQLAGRIALAAGLHRIDFRAGGKIHGALLDLKTVRLRPLNK